MTPDRRATFVGGDVGLEGDTARDGLDGREIDTDDEGIRGHNLRGDLCERVSAVHEAKTVNGWWSSLQPTNPVLGNVRHHDPGAAHKSIRTLDFSRKLYFLFSWISLKAARAR